MSASGRGPAPGPARVVLVDKPAGWTSYDVIRALKRGRRDRLGHAGTLDPFATGLLLVLAGQATRLSELFMGLPKEYLVTAQFGARSSTGDPTGEIAGTGAGQVTAADVLGVLDRFCGTIRQRVPMTSAVKVGGEALYRRAHRGETVETPERDVRVYELCLTGFEEASQRAMLLARTGKGTYVRTLVEDIGEALGVGGYAATLRRTRVGHLSVADAVSPDGVDRESVLSGPASLSLSAALGFLPRVDVADDAARRIRNGQDLAGGPEGVFRVHGREGLLAVYRGPVGRARPLVVFPEPQD